MTAAMAAGVRLRSPAVDLPPLPATAASVGSPGWVGVGGWSVRGGEAAALTSALRRRYGGLCACGDAVSGYTRPKDGAGARLMQCSGVRVR